MLSESQIQQTALSSMDSVKGGRAMLCESQAKISVLLKISSNDIADEAEVADSHNRL
jgi:hypothetical protein